MDETPVLGEVHEHSEISEWVADEVLERTGTTLNNNTFEVFTYHDFQVETSTQITSSL